MDLLQRTLHQCPIDATWNLNKPHRQTGCRPSNCLAALLAYRMDHKNSLICSSRNKNQKAHCRCSRIRVPCDIRHLQDYLRPVFWNPEPIDQWFDMDGRTTRNSVTLAFNSCCITEDLNCLITRAYTQWKAGAYVRWYARFGCTEVRQTLNNSRNKW
ncbi:hypothetical protein FBUS_00074 [Fasciolopsis buskii]|uniref:Uncharacterized protein n=1 Tax=Fasciolopsis buskii TaxID=27845 RepID=A0A8E0VDJ4_9TREM|nr:hypothetical protein FBUS_00074 [Fasciolopsis buski]